LTGVVLSYPGVMQHAQQIARAFWEVGRLTRFVTAFSPRSDGLIAARLVRASSGAAARAGTKLRRRFICEVPSEKIDSRDRWEIARLLAAAATRNPRLVDRIWHAMSLDFDAYVARRYAAADDVSEVHAFEYTALASFKRARESGRLCVLHLPSIENRAFREIEQRELKDYPELADANRSYFDRLFEARQARREQEKDLADFLVCNSTATARSHIDAGSDPARVLVTPLGGPDPISPDAIRYTDTNRALQVVWAGPFSLRKGAHYFLDAWRKLGPYPHAHAHIFGSILLPPRALPDHASSITFHGPVAQMDLFKRFEEADVLVFPTLSDGFGMVVTEALSRGLPVITTTAAGAVDILEPFANGLVVPPADSDALLAALQWCLDNRQKLQDMRCRSLATADRNRWSDFRHRLASATAP
jgi:glycosyltransferase involved in cell wall biosynthesis